MAVTDRRRARDFNVWTDGDDVGIDVFRSGIHFRQVKFHDAEVGLVMDRQTAEWLRQILNDVLTRPAA